MKHSTKYLIEYVTCRSFKMDIFGVEIIQKEQLNVLQGMIILGFNKGLRCLNLRWGVKA